MINENPDMVYDIERKKTYKWTDRDAYAFGYLKGKIYVSDWAKKHSEIDDNYKELRHAYEREDFKFAGRIWIKGKVMSFWKYPSPNKIESIFNDLKKEMKIKNKKDIGNFKDWKIEIKVKRDEIVVPIEQFKNLGSNKIKQRSSKEAGQAHVISPVAKGKIAKPKGWGSQKKIGGLSQTWYHQIRTTSENIEMKKSELKNIIKEEIKSIINEKETIYVVTWQDRNYKVFQKFFKDDKNGAPENGLKKAKRFMKQLEDKDAKDDYGLYRTISLGIK